jgi:hypothetical protein
MTYTGHPAGWTVPKNCLRSGCKQNAPSATPSALGWVWAAKKNSCLAPLAGAGCHAVFAAFNPSRASTASRITNFWILPVTVIGNSSTNST